ncbi:unnamed protein product [Mycena citricolor]|uniref:Magnesium transporter n=1 Tax=Mycena citricolor TaxID=2018698 RepID=A0AAD2HU98_9AGAR|nr:unnamed protein product [Mycena citricolor]
MNSTITNDVPPKHVRHTSPVIAFIIGLSIILLASILNAAGLNLTKLDHVRMSALPKSSRPKDWKRPLWLLGMLLYILSQLIGSTLALEYMRAEYVAPLGSSSLIFNFLFARFLVGTSISSQDIYGTVVVILGVIGIVAFGSINSGLDTGSDVKHLTTLWRRGGWLGYFLVMSCSLWLLLIGTSQLDALLAARGDLNSASLSAIIRAQQPSEPDSRSQNPFSRAMLAFRRSWHALLLRIAEWLELWTGPKDDTTIAWTLGIGWACCGGGLAGGCLVFAKAMVKLVSGTLSHEHTGNQFGHAAPIFTIIFLVTTAVLQIICLNRGLKVYDSTLVVPVFYGVYTASGFLDSLIFNNEVDSYQSWTLFLIFVSIFILISGVVLLTHKKPEPGALSSRSVIALNEDGFPRIRLRQRGSRKAKAGMLEQSADDDEETMVGGEEQALWDIGDASDDESDDGEGQDEDVDHPQHPLHNGPTRHTPKTSSLGEEGVQLLPSTPPPAAHPTGEHLL